MAGLANAAKPYWGGGWHRKGVSGFISLDKLVSSLLVPDFYVPFNGTPADTSGNNRPFTTSAGSFGGAGLIPSDTETSFTVAAGGTSATNAYKPSMAGPVAFTMTAAFDFATLPGVLVQLLNNLTGTTLGSSLRINASNEVAIVLANGTADVTVPATSAFTAGHKIYVVVTYSGTTLTLYVFDLSGSTANAYYTGSLANGTYEPTNSFTISNTSAVTFNEGRVSFRSGLALTPYAVYQLAAAAMGQSMMGDGTYTGWQAWVAASWAAPPVYGYGLAWTGPQLANAQATWPSTKFIGIDSVGTNFATCQVADVETGDITTAAALAGFINGRLGIAPYSASRPTIYMSIAGSYYLGAGSDLLTPLGTTYGLYAGQSYDLWLANVPAGGALPTAPIMTAVGVAGASVPCVATQFANYAETGVNSDFDTIFDPTWLAAI